MIMLNLIRIVKMGCFMANLGGVQGCAGGMHGVYWGYFRGILWLFEGVPILTILGLYSCI